MQGDFFTKFPGVHNICKILGQQIIIQLLALSYIWIVPVHPSYYTAGPDQGLYLICFFHDQNTFTSVIEIKLTSDC